MYNDDPSIKSVADAYSRMLAEGVDDFIYNHHKPATKFAGHGGRAFDEDQRELAKRHGQKVRLVDTTAEGAKIKFPDGFVTTVPQESLEEESPFMPGEPSSI